MFAGQPRAFWLARLRAYDVCAIPVLRPGEALTEPQALHNGVVIELDDPLLGRVAQVGVAARMHDPGSVRGPAPRPGRDSDDVLAELGYDAEGVAALHRSGAVG